MIPRAINCAVAHPDLRRRAVHHAVPVARPSGSPFVTTFESLGLRQAAGIVNFVVVTAALSSFNCIVFSGARMLSSMAGNGLAPASFVVLSAAVAVARGAGDRAVHVGRRGAEHVIPARVFGWLMSFCRSTCRDLGDDRADPAVPALARGRDGGVAVRVGHVVDLPSCSSRSCS